MTEPSSRRGAGRVERASLPFERGAAAAGLRRGIGHGIRRSVEARRVKRWAAVVAVAAGLGALPAAPAHAISTGCAAANAGSFDASSSSALLDTTFTAGFEAGEQLHFVFTANGGQIQTALVQDNTAGTTPIVANTPSNPFSASYTIPATGSRQLVYQMATFLAPVGGSVTVTCTPLPSSGNGSDLGPTAKLLTEFVLNQIVPQNSQTLSDLVNDRFIGSSGGPQFSERNGSVRFRMSLADLRQMSRPKKDDGAKPRQWASAAPADAGRTRGYDIERAQHAAAPAAAERFADQRWNVWAAGNVFAIDVNRSGAAFDGKLYSVLGGVDYKVFEQLLVGVAGGWERYDLDTSFNGGTFKGTGYTVGPYLGVQLAPYLVFDVWGGWTRVNYDLTSQATGALESGSFDANRYFVSANLTGRFEWGALRISPRAGVLYANERQPAYTSSLGNAIPAQTIELGKAMFGPEIGYRIELPDWRMTLEPFAFIRGEYDFVRSGSTTIGTTVIRPERWGARAGGGLALSARNGLSLRVSGSYDSIGRSHEQVIRGEARLGFRF